MKDYLPIPKLGTGGRSFRIAMRHRLYQGADHLLLVQSTGFTDDYRRLFYRDIGHVVVRQTQRRLWNSLFLFVVLLILVWIAIYAGMKGFMPAAITVAVGAAVPALLLAFNIALGPTCVCYISTRVQTIEVPTPQRLAKVPRLIEFLRGKTSGESAPRS